MARAVNDMRQPLNVAAIVIDDCWNRIGIRGDGSCPRLRGYVHCRNCPVHEDAAATLLDHTLSDTDFERSHEDGVERPWEQGITAAPATGDTPGVESLLVFRIGDECLALPTKVFDQVTEMRRIHSLPHRRNPAMLGVVNIRGALVICASLVALLRLEAGAAPGHTGRAEYRRLLVVRAREQLAAFPVDAVDGVWRFARATYESVPTTVACAAQPHTRAVVRWRGRTIGLLDSGLLFETLDRSLA
jgi:chemotaxis-related protein WspD